MLATKMELCFYLCFIVSIINPLSQVDRPPSESEYDLQGCVWALMTGRLRSNFYQTFVTDSKQQ